MRGEIKASIERLESEPKARLREWMRAKGWVLDVLSVAELADVTAYIAAMTPPDDEPEPTE
jgi:hypothetical protein